MTIHLPKVNQFGGGNGGGGGSSSFPVTVTDSGSSLPSASGYQWQDTFLNTSDKKIYTAIADKYIINTSIGSYYISNNLLDIYTGIMDFSIGSVYFSKNSYSNHTYTITIPFVATNVTNYQYIFEISSDSGYPYEYANIKIDNGKLKCGSNDICDIEANKTYIINVSVTGSQYTSSRSGTVKVYTEDGTQIGQQVSFSYSANTIRLFFGYHYEAGPGGAYFSGKILPYAEEYSFNIGGYDVVVPDTNLSWDNGTSLTDKTEYADKTNGILYLYQDEELIQIPQNKNLVFTNVSASSWVSDSTYTDYGYKCELSCSGVTANDFAQVIFAPTEADSGNYATVCLTGANTVTIYSKVNDTITIPSIVVMEV